MLTLLGQSGLQGCMSPSAYKRVARMQASSCTTSLYRLNVDGELGPQSPGSRGEATCAWGQGLAEFSMTINHKTCIRKPKPGRREMLHMPSITHPQP